MGTLISKKMSMEEALQIYFGYTSFLPGQKQIIEAILERNNDILAILPTGGGKSLCYQLPILMNQWTAIIISPLLSLMEDQIQKLNQLHIHACSLSGNRSHQSYAYRMLQIPSKEPSPLQQGLEADPEHPTDEERLEQLIEENAGPVHKKRHIIYLSPERLQNPRICELLQSLSVDLVVVDEAHCVKEWGDQFRPEYQKIADFIQKYRSTHTNHLTIAAFTATVTKETALIICKLLGMQIKDPAKPHILCPLSLDRPNLYLRVIHTEDKKSTICREVGKHLQETGIIYCATPKLVEETARCIQQAFPRLPLFSYHGKMEEKERARMQKAFSVSGDGPGHKGAVMVATVAFGMGIDRADIRYVIHYNMPLSLETYYQEAGRAGRDGKKADCLLLYTPRDISVQKQIINWDPSAKNESHYRSKDRAHKKEEQLLKLEQMEDYCFTSHCLHTTMTAYLGWENPAGHPAMNVCHACGNCTASPHRIDITNKARLFFQTIQILEAAPKRFPFSIHTVIAIVRGTKMPRGCPLSAKDIPTYGLLASETQNSLLFQLRQLQADGYLIKVHTQKEHLTLAKKAIQSIKNKETIWYLPLTVETAPPAPASHGSSTTKTKPVSQRRTPVNTDAAAIHDMTKEQFMDTLGTLLAEELNIPISTLLSGRQLVQTSPKSALSTLERWERELPPTDRRRAFASFMRQVRDRLAKRNGVAPNKVCSLEVLAKLYIPFPDSPHTSRHVLPLSDFEKFVKQRKTALLRFHKENWERFGKPLYKAAYNFDHLELGDYNAERDIAMNPKKPSKSHK